MNCPQCSHKQKRGKAGMTCQSCGYAFVFDPKKDRLQGRALTDGLFGSILSAASAGQSLVYTHNQLYLFACARYRKLNKFSPILAVIIIVLSFFAGIISGVYIVSMLGVPVVAIFHMITRRKRLRRDAWDACLTRWENSGQALPNLVPDNALQDPPPEWEEPDIYDYGALGLLLCQRNDIVDWLVLNKLPAELKLVVLSESGYPTYLVPVVSRLLQEQPDLPIYLLHDGTQIGAQMTSRLPTAFPILLDEHPIFSLGMAPDELDHLPSRQVLPKEELQAKQALDSIPYSELVSLIAVSISTTPPQSLSAAWTARRAQAGQNAPMIVDDGDFG